MAVLDLVHISHRYTKGGAFGGRQSNQVLFDVSLSLDAGSTVALVGTDATGAFSGLTIAVPASAVPGK